MNPGLPRVFCHWLLPFLGVVCFATAGAAATSPQPTNPAGFVIRRGTNLSHWLSQDFGWAPRAVWITENDLRYIARLGFDHVRLPVDEKELWGEDGSRNTEAFALMKQAIGWARAHGLRVVLDLHTVRAHHFNAVNEGMTPNTLFTDPAAQRHFLDLWRQLSDHLRDQPVDLLAYEIMNEPVADDPEDWNKLVAASVAAIREREPQRVLVIGSNRWQMPVTFPHLRVPAGDRNIILSTHTYSPLPFTHYRAEWVPTKDYAGPIHYPGRTLPADEHARLMQSDNPVIREQVASASEEWNAARLAQELEPAIRRARELGLQLYCGEFGCLPTVPRADRLAYYRDLIGVFEQHGLAYANWEYKGDFGLFEWHGPKHLIGAPDHELIDALLGRKPATR